MGKSRKGTTYVVLKVIAHNTQNKESVLKQARGKDQVTDQDRSISVTAEFSMQTM